MLSGVTVPQFDKAGRGGFMRRFLTLVCLLSLAIPAGISISGCTRNPAANYCNGAGYGMKITDVATITLQPATTGISMAFGQTRQVSSPSALTCKGTTASAGSYTYGTTNNQLVDISPAGSICAGTWNRNSGGGIPDYTVCTPPNPLPSTGSLPYATAYISASAQGVTSNPVEVFIHAAVTSVGLVTEPVSGTAQQCFSQGNAATLDAQACYSGTNSLGQSANVLLCAPATVTSNFACPLPQGVTSVPNCTAALGTLSYSVGTSSVASITTNTTTNQVTITAEQPGTTAITSSVSQTGSSAGYFSTCPPKSISVTLANGSTSGTITQGATQNLTTTIYDNNLAQCPVTGCAITGLSLTYQSTDPMDITAGSSGAITTTFPGTASVYAICQPPGCNPAPINEIGIYGTGLPVASNAVTITTPGTASDYAWFAAPGQSQYIVPIQLLTGTVGSTIRLPYVPNSMVMDQLGTSLYFGSPHELMVYSTSSGAVTTQSTGVPGVVLAVSPNNTQVLVNDQVRQLFYIYNVSGGSAVTTGGMGNAAAWTPDSQTLYITDNKALNNANEGITGHTDTLYVYNASTGWSTYGANSSTPLPPNPLQNPPLPPGFLPPSAGYNPTTALPGNVAISSTMQTPAIVIPSMGAFFRGETTVDHTWCPTGTVGNFASLAFYPQPAGDSVPVENDALAATTDGKHILGAAVIGSGVTVNDISVNIPTAESPSGSFTPISCPLTTNAGVQTLLALPAAPALNGTFPLDTGKVNATAVNQVVASPESNLAFITYTADTANTNAYLPYYVPGTNGAAGTVGYVPLTGGSTIIAPLAGAFTPDDSLFFVSTAGDNMIHFISVPLATNPATAATADTQQISPKLPPCTPSTDAGCTLPSTSTGPYVPATAIAVKPRSTT
jgi:hypothetical protein